MKFIWISVFLLSWDFYLSQSAVLYNLHNSALTSNAINKIGVTDFNNNDYLGSPYLENNFLPSTIEKEKGIHLIRYNIYNDEIILQKDDNYFKIPKISDLSFFLINDKHIIRLVNETYYIQSSSEKNNLVILRKENIKFTQGKISENGYSQNTPSKFTNGKPDYFLYNIEDKKLIPAKKDDLKSAYPNKSNELDQIFKKYKFKNKEDYQELINIFAN